MVILRVMLRWKDENDITQVIIFAIETRLIQVYQYLGLTGPIISTEIWQMRLRVDQDQEPEMESSGK